MAVLEFYCRVCGSPHSVDLETIPRSGIRGPCKECGAMITVYPDGRLKGGDTGFSNDEDLSGKKQANSPPREKREEAQTDESLTVEFQCPSCSWLHRIPARRVGADGLEGHCSQCHKPLKVFPDGSVSLNRADKPASGPVRPAGSEYGGPWEVNVSGEPMGPFTLPDMKELARSGKLAESSLVRPPGEGRWSSAERFQLLSAIWKSPDEDGPEPFPGTRDQCHAHPSRVPVRQCTECGFYMCADCLKTRDAVGMVLSDPLCGACGGKTVPLKILRTRPPFYRDLKHVFLSAFQWPAPIYLGFLAFLEILKTPARQTVFGLWAILALTIFQTVFYLEVMRQAATGSYEIPEWPEINHFPEMIWEYMKVVLVGLVALLPAILVFCLLSSSLVPLLVFGPGRETPMPGLGLLVLAALFCVVYLVYLPASIGLAAVFDSLPQALNPIHVWRTIGRIGPAYWLAAGFWAALLAARVGGQILLDTVPVAGVVLSGILTAYLYLIMSYIWGRVLFENEKKITRT